MGLTAHLSARAYSVQTGLNDHGTPQAALDCAYSKDVANGTGADQGDHVFSDQRTLAASASENLDLSGVLVDALGNVLNFAKIKWILIKAAEGNTNNVVVGNAAANGNPLGFGAVANTWAIPPGGVFFATNTKNGWTVTGGTLDQLKIANSGSGTSVTYDIQIGGNF